MPHGTFQEVLTQIRQSQDDGRPGFSLFLGAGASKSAGVLLAEELADLAFEQSFRDAGNTVRPEESREDLLQRVRAWEKAQQWYDEDKSRYVLAMEHALLAPGVRMTFLRKHTRSARVTIAYRRLAQLLAKRVFDTVYTTNFDDLVLQAVQQAAGSIDHVASLEQYLRQNPSPSNPRLIRLHGDYSHGDILNTKDELEATPQVRLQKVHQLSCPQGMIVMGYGGQDRRIMIDLFEKHMSDPRFLENGLFWCIRRGSDVPHHVLSLRDRYRGRVHITEIESFDHAMEALAVGFELRTDSWILQESLITSVGVQALMVGATELLVDLSEGIHSVRDRIEDVFTRLSRQLAASRGLLIGVQSDTARFVAGANLPWTLQSWAYHLT